MIKVSFLLIFIVVVLHLAFAEDTDGGGGHEPQQPKKNQKDLSGNQIPVNEQLQPAGKGRQIVPSVDEDKSLKTRKGENIQEKQQQQASADDNSSNKIQKPLGGTGDGATGLLADQPECAKEVALYCQDALKTSDVIVMQCLLNVRPDGSHLGDTCHHLLWTYKAMMTEDQRFHQAAEQFCQAEFNQFKDDCNVPKEKAEKHLLFCLIDHKENMTTDGQCRNFLTRVETIVFSDFHLIGPFVTACRNEIENLKCGKVQEENDRQHTQGSTIACLLQKLVQTGKGADELNPKCRHELLRLAELQADDFNLDRPLYYACRDDRDKFCGEVQAGEGRVLACLTQLATHPHMSSLCREKLLLRQQVVAQDYRVSHALMRACQKDINQWKCQPAGADDFPQFFLSYVLLCLENAMHSGKQVAGECQAQMFDHRQAIMSDYRINPEIVLHCTPVISAHCSKNIEAAQTLHCLMRFVRTNENEVDSSCKAAVFNLVKVADIGSDYRVDPLLQKSCGAAIQTLCSEQQNSETEVMSCLMNNADAKVISEECEDRLLEVQFFLSRDFSLDPNLYRACKSDAVKKCNAPKDWGLAWKNDTKPETTGLILPCLFRYSYVKVEEKDHQLDPKCVAEVRRVLRERAVSVQLLPGIGEKCVRDLSDLCQKVGKGEEMDCLKQKLTDIKEDDCKAAVMEFAEAESKDFQLNRILTKSCRPVIERYCHSLVAQDIDNGEVLECLRGHKMESEMTSKCRSYVNHYELITMSDYKFSYKFKKSCKEDVEIFCKGVNQNKAEIIKCLSEVLFEHTVLGPKDTETHTLSKECRKQLRVEYLEVRQNEEIIKPKLMAKCKSEIDSRCATVEGQANVMECLRDNKDELGPECRQHVFRHEEIQFNDNTFDTMLQKACGPVINNLCPKEDRTKVLSCLKRSKYLPGMTPECLAVVQTRQREQVADLMLQPSLREKCSGDIKLFCGEAVQAMKKIRDMPGKERNLLERDGKRNPVLICLRKQFAITNKQTKTLSAPCRMEVQQIIMESEVDPRLDPPFYAACKKELARGECGQKVATGSASHTDMVECVKSRYYRNLVTDARCKEELDRRTSEELSDVHVDTVLYEVCAADIKHYCNDLQPGMGRRIQCILKATESSNVQLAEACRIKLEERKKLWKQALKNNPPESMQEFAYMMNESPVRNTAMTVVAVALIGIFLFGLCFGRCTKRIRRELKNK